MSLPPRPDPEAARRNQYRELDTTAGPSSPAYYARPPPSEPYSDLPTPTSTPGMELGRKKSLIKPERMRIGRDHPNYYYRQHAQQRGVEVMPSSTGNDPILEDQEAASASTDSTLHQHHQYEDEAPQGPRKLQRQSTRRQSMNEKHMAKQKQKEQLSPPSAWNVYCAIITFWAPDAIMRCFGMPQKAQMRAWREKMGLISIIILICAFVGFLTFGFTEAVCKTTTERLKANHVDKGYLIIQGRAYNMVNSKHPAALGITAGTNILYNLEVDGQTGYGGRDASFMFQNVNGNCKGLITKTDNSTIISDSDGNLAWYFPCKSVRQDGSSQPNDTLDAGQYEGWACHTSESARKAYWDMTVHGEVYYTWDDLKNKSRNLVVYSGSVLDLNLITWLNKSQVDYPTTFDEIREDSDLRGTDITHRFGASAEKKVAKCLGEILRVGSIDTETVGCIASQVVLYVSLAFIVSIVLAKFFMALFFGWFLSWRLGAGRDAAARQNMKARREEIEDWADDIYRPAPKLQDANNDRQQKRGSFLPTTSRFTSPYAQERAPTKPVMTTMGSQTTSTGRHLAPGSNLYSQGNTSQGSLSGMGTQLLTPSYGSGAPGDRFSQGYTDSDVGPAGFIHEAVVPQPPPEYQPHGFPLAHCMCLITCYSEGEQGVRTTLDSIATTDYPNSHKLMLIICDGMIMGSGETMTTPDIILSMMKDHAIPPEKVPAFSYVAVASGSKRHNMAKVYAGFYDYGDNSIVPTEKQQRVPMLVVVKCGTPDEANTKKPGNRGKRDSQIILMSFLQKVMFDERMTELEFEMFNGIWKITGMSPDYYEMVLMVDADTKVFPDSLTHMIGAMVYDPEIMGLCGETKIANKTASWVSMIQVFEYFISHHLTKAFESVFGGVTCLPGCFCMYRIKAPKGGQNYWVPILANPDVVEHYSENVVETLHTKNLLLLGEDRYLSTLMLKTFPKRKQIFVPQAVCKTVVPDEFKVLLSQRRRWINSTVHNLMELVLVRDLCGTFCFSMQFVVFIELVGTLVLPAAIAFTFYLGMSPERQRGLPFSANSGSHHINLHPSRPRHPARPASIGTRSPSGADRTNSVPLVLRAVDVDISLQPADLEPGTAQLCVLEV
jgi:chitin synthase